MSKPLPPTPDILEAWAWLKSNCPASSCDHDAKKCAEILLDLFDALPSHFSQYRFGTKEYKKAMGITPRSKVKKQLPAPHPDCNSCHGTGEYSEEDGVAYTCYCSAEDDTNLY